LAERHLSGKGIKPILYTTLAGALLPVYCIGSLPMEQLAFIRDVTIKKIDGAIRISLGL